MESRIEPGPEPDRLRNVGPSRTDRHEAVPESLLRRIRNLQYHRFYKLSFMESGLSKFFEKMASFDIF